MQEEPSRSRIGIKITLLAIGALMANACGEATTDPAAIVEPEVVYLEVADMATFALPLDAYRLSAEQARTLADAAALQVQQCMSRFGFPADAPIPPPASDPPTGNERLYGLTDRTVAETRGYYAGPLPDESTNSTSLTPQEPPAPTEDSEAWYAVAHGTLPRTEDGQQVPEGGCIGEMRRTLATGAPEADTALADRLAIDAHHRAQEDSRVQEAFSAWSRCMARAGYDYATPWEANNDIQWTAHDGPRPTQEEIATAVTDVDCKHEVDLINIWASVHTAYELQAVEAHAEALDAVAEYRAVELANAREILDSAVG